MNHRLRGSVFLLAIATSLPAQTSTQATGKDPYEKEPLVIEHLDTSLRMRGDGTGEGVRHVVIRLQSQGAVQQTSVLVNSYNAENSTGTIDNVKVHKPDGSVVVSPATDSVELPAPVTHEAPMYSDLKQRQLPVRALSPGDTLEYDFRTVYRKAEALNQFWGAEHFQMNGVVLSETLLLEVPADKYVQVWSPQHKPVVSEHDGIKSYRWTSEQKRPTPATVAESKAQPIKDPDVDTEGRILPSVAWTTFRSWAEVGEWYHTLAQERVAPTEALRRQAEQLTREAKTPEQQIQALYAFVSEKTRYVGIDLGAGRYQPHFAEETLRNQYGDCKDKDTLLEALLRAKGFQTAPALVGVGITAVPDLPSPALFNHVVTTVMMPSAAGSMLTPVWLDATPGIAPYGVLTPQIRDEDVLVIPETGPASLQRTPALPRYAYVERFTVEATLDQDGLLLGHIVLTARSDSEFGLRAVQQFVAPAQWDQTAQALSSNMGFAGTVSHADLGRSAPTEPVKLSWDYRRPEFADWSGRRILPLFPSLELAVIDKETAPEYDIDQGTPRTLEAVTRIKLPEGYRAELPNAVHVSRPYATYDQTYQLSGGELKVSRRVVVLQKKVPKAKWKDYLAYADATGMNEGEKYVQLIAPEKTQAQKEPPPGSTPKDKSGSEDRKDEKDSSSVESLMQLAEQQMKQNDVAGEKATLLKIKAQAPDTPYLMSMLGYIAMRDGKVDEAIASTETELKKHPDDNSAIPLLLARYYGEQKRYGEAVTLLTSYEGRNELKISQALAWFQQRKGDTAAAVATFARAADHHPEDRQLLSSYASALHESHRDLEAVAAAKAAMDDTDDASLLNDNSYLLATIGTDLPLAERNARRAVEMREAETARVTVTEANTAAFAATEQLFAAYDTLAYILLKEQKAKEAEPYQRAAWFAQPDIIVGYHLALVEEALGKRDDALTIDELALATENAAAMKTEYAEVQGNVERLHKAGAQSKAGSPRQQLQDMRTFKVKRPPEVKGWGTFRVQLDHSGIIASDLVSGSASVKPMVKELEKIPIRDPVPSGSKAKVLRDGVLSCSSGQETCEFVLMPHSGLRAEGIQ